MTETYNILLRIRVVFQLLCLLNRYRMDIECKLCIDVNSNLYFYVDNYCEELMVHDPRFFKINIAGESTIELFSYYTFG